MRLLRNLWRSLFRKQEIEQQLDAELRSYLDLVMAQKIQQGLDPQTARREALIDLGGLEQVKEQVRDVRAGRPLEGFYSDLRHAWRMTFKMPLTAIAVVMSLGVGIGVNTTVFSWIQAVVFQPMPGVSGGGSFQHLEVRTETDSYPGLSWLEYGDIRSRVDSFRDLLAFRMVPFNVGETSRAERVYGLLVSGNYFSALGLIPALGRFIEPEEVASPGAGPVVVISYEYWQTRFGGAASALGARVRVNGYPLTIIGVAPAKFQGTVLGLNFSLWTPATMAPLLLNGSAELRDRNLRGYSVLGRLQHGKTRAQAQAELDRVMRQLAQAYPESNSSLRGEVIPFWLAPRGPQRMLAGSLALLQGIMMLLLLAVCGNTAILMLARASTRQREIGVRLAMGAGPWRVARLLLTESLMLALFGACLGAGIAVWGTQALRAVPMIGAFPIKFQTSVDGLDLAFAMLLGLASGLVFGLFPAIQLVRIDPQAAFRTGSGTARSPLRNTIMGIQVALALLVLVVAALFFRSFRETRAADPGFRRDGILLAAYDLSGRKANPAFARTVASRLLEQLRALPSIESASIASSVPLDIHGMPMLSFTVEGHARPSAALDRALTNSVTPGYFATMDIPLRAGKDFADLSDVSAPPQVIVNEEFSRRYLENLNPLGRHVQTRNRSYVITGVARNSVYDSFGERPAPIVYFSYRDRPAPAGEIHVRARVGSELLLASDLRRIVRGLDPTLSIYDLRTMNEHVEKNAMLRRIPAQMFVVLGPLLLMLAGIGIYAVVACSVAQRTTEISLRLALGATPQRLVRQIAGETLSVVCIGALGGWLVALLVDIHLARGVIHLPIFVGVPAVLLMVAALACWLPARRASRVDPMTVLRQE